MMYIYIYNHQRYGYLSKEYDCMGLNVAIDSYRPKTPFFTSHGGSRSVDKVMGGFLQVIGVEKLRRPSARGDWLELCWF